MITFRSIQLSFIRRTPNRAVEITRVRPVTQGLAGRLPTDSRRPPTREDAWESLPVSPPACTHIAGYRFHFHTQVVIVI